MAFIRHTETRRSFLPRVTLSRNGLMSFTEAAVRKYALRDYSYLVLYFDPDQRIVGIEPVNDKQEDGAMKIRHREQGAFVAAKSFMGRFDIRIEGTTTYELDKSAEFGYLTFDLKRGRVRRSSGVPAESNEEISGDDVA